MDNAQEMYVICPNCKQYVSSKNNFCHYCGYMLNDVNAPNFITFSQSLPANNYYVKKKNISYGFILGIISCIACFIGLFMPFVEIDVFGFTNSFEMFDTEFGDNFLIVTIIALVCILAKKGIPAIIFGFVLTSMMIEKTVDMNDLDFTVDNYDLSGFVTKGAGYYVMLIFSLLIIVAGIIICFEKKDK